MSYPYVHPSPFEKAQRYDYADVESDAFFASWQAQRQVFLADMQRADEIGAGPEYAAVSDLDDTQALSLAYILWDIRALKSYGALFPFIKKFEVFGKFYSHYRISDLRKAPDACAAPIEDYVLFAELLLEACEAQDNLQYLSTLLKLCDIFCGLRVEDLSASVRARMADVICDEVKLVLSLSEKVDA